MSETQGPLTMKRPDKIAGLIIAALVIGGLGWVLTIVMPVLVELAKNTIIFSVELLVLVLLAIVFLDTRTWTAIYYKWQNISRKIRRAIVREDPIGIMDTVIQRLGTRLEGIDEKTIAAVGARKRQDAAIEEAEKKSREALGLATAAKLVNKSVPEIAQHAEDSQMWSAAADDMRPMAAMLARLQDQLEQARDICSQKLSKAKSKRNVVAFKLGALRDGRDAVRGIKGFFTNNPDLEYQEMAVDEFERQSNEDEAEIDQFMRVMSPVLETAKLQKQADTLQAMDKFEKFLQDGPAKVAALPAGVQDAVLVGAGKQEAGR